MSEVKKVIDKEAIGHIALSIRSLSMDAIQKAKSGHPGLPLGCAELGASIYAEILSYYPEDPQWINRDRFILSAGHGSMLLYSLLHLSGYAVSVDDIKNFRQLGSITPGHPEYGKTPGVETTTGPLGAGVSNAVGMAIAEKMLSARFNTDAYNIIDHYTYVLASDGDIMEGVTAESVSLAGHLGLGKLIMYYDSNSITIEGSTNLAFTEDVAKRFEGYNWHIQQGSAYDIQGIIDMTQNAREEKERPSIIILNSIIGKGTAHMEGSPKSHGAPLGEDEIIATRKKLNIPEDASFFVHPGAYEFFRNRKMTLKQQYDRWNEQFNAWKNAEPELAALWNQFFGPVDLTGFTPPEFKTGDTLATRAAGGQILNAIADIVPNIVGGSADLSPSTLTTLKNAGDFFHDSPLGRNIHFGVREHAMGGILNGIALHKGLRPYGSTFLIFSDYMRPSIRLACLMKLPVIYVFTHDSIFVGEDGPTHQPVEQITALRIIPHMLVLRPGDPAETIQAWRIALKHQGPVALALTRQGLTVYEKDDPSWEETITHGAYIVKESKQEPDIVIIASGSEVNLALSSASKRPDISIRVVSVLSPSLFYEQSKEFKDKLIPKHAKRICIEAGIGISWEKIIRDSDHIISIEQFGDSGPYKKLADTYGLNEEAVLKAIDKVID